MIEVVGNIWDYPADLYCITTNGDVNAQGRAVMGRGVAKQAAQRFPEVDRMLAYVLRKRGNVVSYLGYWAPFSPASSKSGQNLMSFPVKHHWRDKADLALIATSCLQLVAFMDQTEAVWDISGDSTPRGRTAVIPRPGCGNGQRDWELEVRPILSDLLDDRFHVIDLS